MNDTTMARRRELQAEIAAAAAELDRRNGTPAGTALRAIYWAFYPPSETTGIDTLENLLIDAHAFLLAASACA